MAWDTVATRHRIRDAALVEFAANGPNGTTMTAIAQRAGVNKERIYNYFGDKRAFYDSILSEELTKLAAEVITPGEGLEEIGEFAGRTFDYYSAHPELARLLLWEGLAGGAIADEESRRAIYASTVSLAEQAVSAGVFTPDLPADHIVLFVLCITSSWFYVPQLVEMLAGPGLDGGAENVRRRASVVTAARRIAMTSNP